MALRRPPRWWSQLPGRDAGPVATGTTSGSLDAGEPAKAVGVPAIRFHHLRHTRATSLLNESMHAMIVGQRLGHANIAITLYTYSHVLPCMQ
jgi:integrase